MQDQVDKSMIAKIMSSILIGIVMKDYAFEHNPPDDEIEGGEGGEGEGVVFISQENHQQISSVLTQFLLREPPFKKGFQCPASYCTRASGVDWIAHASLG